MTIEPDILEVARRLQAWIDSVETIEDPYPVVIEFSDYFQSISIGDFCVWTNEDGADEMNVDTCREKWQDHIRSLIPWLEELYIVQMPKPDEHGCTLYGIYTNIAVANDVCANQNKTVPGHRVLISVPDLPKVRKRKRRKP